MGSSGFCSRFGGDEEIRTPDPLLARQVLSQLSYTPICFGIFVFVLFTFSCFVSTLSCRFLRKLSKHLRVQLRLRLVSPRIQLIPTDTFPYVLVFLFLFCLLSLVLYLLLIYVLVNKKNGFEPKE